MVQPLPRAGVSVCVFWCCCCFFGWAVNSHLWWPLQRRGVAGKRVEGGVEMESTGDEQCCGLHHHHHHHHPHHHHHQHHHHQDLHEDSLGSDSSLGAQSDLSEDSTQVRLPTHRRVACMCHASSAVLACPFVRTPDVQSDLLWATPLMKDFLCLRSLLGEQVVLDSACNHSQSVF